MRQEAKTDVAALHSGVDQLKKAADAAERLTQKVPKHSPEAAQNETTENLFRRGQGEGN
jgi:hypothetical protein